MPLSYSSDDSLYTHLIWHCSEDINFFRSKLNLTNYELEILAKRKNSKKALEFLCSRLLLRLCKLDPNDLSYNEFGAPILKSGKFVSISHCKNYVTLLLSNQSCGVDIETKRKQILNIKHKFLNQTDINNISMENISDITLIWTLKEAIYKLCQYPGINFKDQIFISTIDIKNNLANAYVDIDGSITNLICKFQINKEYICSTVFIDDGLS
ncbi:MAG: 4'-phosphopantetheinyl transferase superfamily protein [Flavobacteriaceae bacterium]